MEYPFIELQIKAKGGGFQSIQLRTAPSTHYDELALAQLVKKAIEADTAVGAEVVAMRHFTASETDLMPKR